MLSAGQVDALRHLPGRPNGVRQRTTVPARPAYSLTSPRGSVTIPTILAHTLAKVA